MIKAKFLITKELKARLDKRSDVNWPEIFKQGLKKKLEKLEILKARGEL